MVKTKRASSNQIVEMQKQLESLQKENATLKKELTHDLPSAKRRGGHGWIKKAAIIFFVTLSVVCFMLFNLSSWVKNTLLDTDTFVTTMQPVIAQPAVQETLQIEITDALFEKVDIQQELQNTLPENIAFLSGPLANQIESFTFSKVGEILASPQIYNLWGQLLATVQTQVVGYILNDNADGVITINEIYTAVSTRISEDSKLAFLTNKQLPEKLGTITIAEVSWTEEARRVADALTIAPLIFLAVSVASFLLAVVLSTKRRVIALVILILTTIILLATVIALAIGNWQLGESVDAAYKEASQAVFSTITQPLENRTYGYAALFGAVSLILIVTSRAAFIKKPIRYIDKKLVALASKLVPKGTSAPMWLTNYSQHVVVVCWTVFIVLFVIIGVRIPPEYTEIKSGLLWASFVVLLLYFVHVLRRAFAKTDSK